jgi:hypothetical protein
MFLNAVLPPGGSKFNGHARTLARYLARQVKATFQWQPVCDTKTAPPTGRTRLPDCPLDTSGERPSPRVQPEVIGPDFCPGCCHGMGQPSAPSTRKR